MIFSEDEIKRAAELLNAHSKVVESHWEATLVVIGDELNMTREQVEQLISTKEVEGKWNL